MLMDPLVRGSDKFDSTRQSGRQNRFDPIVSQSASGRLRPNVGDGRYDESCVNDRRSQDKKRVNEHELSRFGDGGGVHVLAGNRSEHRAHARA